MKPLLISLTSNIPGVGHYIGSLKNLGDSVEPLMVTFAPEVPLSTEYRTIKAPVTYPGNLSRFKYFPFDEIADDQMVVFTDTSDVIFQCPLPELEMDKIYVCPENALFDDHSWWKNFFERTGYHGLDGKPIFNMGCWAMSGAKAKELIGFVNDSGAMFGFDEYSDQPLFNLWLQNQVCEVHPTLMTCLFDNLSTNNVSKSKKGFVNQKDELYSIVHANGGTELKELLVSK